MNKEANSPEATISFGRQLGRLLKGGDIVELVGDIGSGKTTLTKGIARGMGIDEDIQSPTYTISRVYPAPDGRILRHYDFYRLEDAGIMREELDEALDDSDTVVVIEWGEVVGGVLPEDRLVITVSSPDASMRLMEIAATGERSRAIAKELM